MKLVQMVAILMALGAGSAQAGALWHRSAVLDYRVAADGTSSSTEVWEVRADTTAVALAGPSPLGGPADLVLVAEDPGVGLGARIAGTDGVDPGTVPEGAPDAKVLAAGHPTPLWRCGSAEDRVAFVGEAAGIWLWAVLWPPAAELVLLEHVELHDLRSESHANLDLPIGAPSPRLQL